MAIQSVADARFRVSEEQTLVDIFNRHNGTRYTVDTLRFNNFRSTVVAGIESAQRSPTVTHGKIINGEIVLREFPVSYYRLDMASRIARYYRYVLRTLTIPQMLDSIASRLSIRYSLAHVTVTPVETSDGLSYWKITADSQNPIWTGEILFERVNAETLIERDTALGFIAGAYVPPTPAPTPPEDPDSDVTDDALGNQIEFVFTVPATLWTINHHLGAAPTVTTVNEQGNVIVGQVQYISSNVIEINWGYPQAGKAILR